MHDSSRQTPVFIDLTGRRWRHIRRAALAVGIVTTTLAVVLVGTLFLTPPIPPEIPLATSNNEPIARATTGLPGAFRKADPLRLAYRPKLAEMMKPHGTPSSRRPETVPLVNLGTGNRPPRRDSILPGLYV